MLWDEPARSQARTTAYVKRLCTSKDALRVFYSLVQAIPMSVYHVSSAKPPTPVGLHQRVQYIDAMYHEVQKSVVPEQVSQLRSQASQALLIRASDVLQAVHCVGLDSHS